MPFSPQRKPKRSQDVFGVSNQVLPDSYVDRGDLDHEVRRLSARPTHIALRGVSKCGKSWLRQTVLPEALTVQCRLGKTVLDIYKEALGELGVRLELSSTSTSRLVGRVEASGEAGIKLLAKVTGKVGAESARDTSTTTTPIARDVHDLRMIAEIVNASGRRLVIEDFHYLSVAERKTFAFDLKALWDFGVFVVIIGVWSKQNMLLYLNPDLSGRVTEVPIVWGPADLARIIEKGGDALNLRFCDEFKQRAVADCYENAGILQKLVLDALDRLHIEATQADTTAVNDLSALEDAELFYAEQLDPLYQGFAQRVAGGIRVRENSTGIYAHAMASVLSASDEHLIRGISIDRIFQEANAREPRIQKGNLRTVLERIESLQVDDDGRGLVLDYNERTGEVSVVDRQLLLYRKYSTAAWPWEDLIRDAESRGEAFNSV